MYYISFHHRLNLPGNVVENGNATAKYDADTGTFELVLPKEIPGEHFKDLDLLTKLLAPKVKPSQQPFIENIENGTVSLLAFTYLVLPRAVFNALANYKPSHKRYSELSKK